MRRGEGEGEGRGSGGGAVRDGREVRVGNTIRKASYTYPFSETDFYRQECASKGLGGGILL